MAKAHPTLFDSIPPFPPDTDREAFGHWLSGFVDGEGCFPIAYSVAKDGRRNYSCRFQLSLRADDIQVLRLIQSFWQCGFVEPHYTDSRIGNRKPSSRLRIQDTYDLRDIVIPHFDRYPLRAKKRADFLIWREAALLLADIYSRPTIGKPGGGRLPKFTEGERNRYVTLFQQIKEQRAYR